MFPFLSYGSLFHLLCITFVFIFLTFCTAGKANGAMANEKEKEQIATARPSPARTTKDQPTLHQFVTPIRKRKRSIEKGESPQTPPSRTPSTSTPTQSTPSGGTPKMIPGKGTPSKNHCRKASGL